MEIINKYKWPLMLVAGLALSIVKSLYFTKTAPIHDNNAALLFDSSFFDLFFILIIWLVFFVVHFFFKNDTIKKVLFGIAAALIICYVFLL